MRAETLPDHCSRAIDDRGGSDNSKYPEAVHYLRPEIAPTVIATKSDLGGYPNYHVPY